MLPVVVFSPPGRWGKRCPGFGRQVALCFLAEERGGVFKLLEFRWQLELPHRLVSLPHALGHLIHPQGDVGHISTGHGPFGQRRDF